MSSVPNWGGPVRRLSQCIGVRVGQNKIRLVDLDDGNGPLEFVLFPEVFNEQVEDSYGFTSSGYACPPLSCLYHVLGNGFCVGLHDSGGKYFYVAIRRLGWA